MADIMLSEATFEQLATEVNSRSPNFLLVVQAEDGSHGPHRHIYYGGVYESLGLAVFASRFLADILVHPESSEGVEPTEEDLPDVE